jgi:hypothetical protein
MPSRDTHFGHRETAGIGVDLFWSHGDPGDEFRGEVQETRGETGSCSIRRRGLRRSRPSTTGSHRRAQAEPASGSERSSAVPRPDRRHQRTPVRYRKKTQHGH